MKCRKCQSKNLSKMGIDVASARYWSFADKGRGSRGVAKRSWTCHQITPTRIAAWLRLWNALVALVVGAATGALVALFGPLLFVSLLSLPVRLAEGPIVLGILVFFSFGFLVGAPIALAWERRGGASLAVGFAGGHICVTTWFATAWLSILHLLDPPFDFSQAAGWITLFCNA